MTHIMPNVGLLEKQAWGVKKKKIMGGISTKYKKKETMPYKEEKTFDAADKAAWEAKEPKRKDYPKGILGKLKFKKAYADWLADKI